MNACCIVGMNACYIVDFSHPTTRRDLRRAALAQVLPQSWAGDTIMMRCTPVVRPVLGPHSASLDLTAACYGLAFHQGQSALYAPDPACFHRFSIPEPPAAAFAWPMLTPVGLDLPIRALDFGPDGELYAVSNSRVFRLPPGRGAQAELLAGGGPAGNDATGAAAGFQDLWGIAVGQVARPPTAHAARRVAERGGRGRRRASS